jgi:hypothetical protein
MGSRWRFAASKLAYVLTGIVNQIAWGRQIRDQINAEFDCVRTVLESAARNRAADNRQDIEAIMVILEDKRAEVMARGEAGYKAIRLPTV